MATADSEDEDFMEANDEHFRRPMIVPPLHLGAMHTIDEFDSDDESENVYQDYSQGSGGLTN